MRSWFGKRAHVGSLTMISCRTGKAAAGEIPGSSRRTEVVTARAGRSARRGQVLQLSIPNLGGEPLAGTVGMLNCKT